MSRRLTEGVLVRHPNSGVVEFLPEGSSLPGWASGLVGEHALTAAPPEPERVAESGQPTPPPRSGAGSEAEAWREYAEAVDVKVPEDAARKDIIEALVKANKPV